MTIIDLDQLAAPSIHGLATPQELELLAWDTEHAITRPHPGRDGWDRYKLADPTDPDATPKGWTRVTTFCEAIDDGSGLTKWKLGLTARGLALNKALHTQARHEHDNDEAIRAIAENAHVWAGSKLSAAVGTALHTATEHADLGTGQSPPAPWDRHVTAYSTALGSLGIEVLEGWIERIVICPELGTAGTLDRLLVLTKPITIGNDTLPAGTIVVGDLKTGKDVRKVTYAVQAACYAGASHAWTPDGWQDMPAVNSNYALIIHLSQITGECDIVAVDIAGGWERAQICKQVRDGRSVKGLFATPVGELHAMGAPSEEADGDQPVPLADVLPAVVEQIQERCDAELIERSTEARDRLKVLRDHPEAVATVARSWPADTPHRPPWTAQHLDAIELVLHLADGRESTHLGTPDPELVAAVERRKAEFETWTNPPAPTPTRIDQPTPPSGDTMSPDDIAALKASIASLEEPGRHRLAAWVADGKRQRQPWGPVKAMSSRTHALYVASIRCVTHLWDPDEPDALTRAALHHTIDEQLDPTWTTGAVIGSLTIAEAQHLDGLAAAFGASDEATVQALGLTVITYTESSEQ